MTGLSEGQRTPGAAEKDGRRAGGRKRRRWVRWVLIPVGVLVLLVAATPYIASTGPAVRFITSLVNERIRGHLEVGEASLGWFSPIRVRGVRLADPAGQQVLRVEAISTAGGVWDVLRNYESFRHLEVISPRVELHELPGGGFSIVEAVAARQPREGPEESAPLPQLIGTVLVREASVLVVRADGRRYEVPRINAEIAMNTLAELSGTATAQLAQRGQVTAQFRLTGLADRTAIRPDQIIGTLAVRTPQAINLGPIGQFALDNAGVAGTLELVADASVKGRDVQVRYDLKAASVTAARAGHAEITPIDVSLQGDVAVSDRKIGGAYMLTGGFGRLQGSLRYEPAGRSDETLAADILAAVLSGQRLNLPQLSLETSGRVDLPKLAKAIPALLRIRPDVTVESGVVTIQDVSVRGGEAPEARGEVSLTDLTARRAGRRIRWKPMTMRFDAAIQPGRGLAIGQVRFDSDFLHLDANGTPAGYRAGYDADLKGLTSQLGEVFDMGDLVLAGTSRGTLTVAIPAQDRMDLTVRSDLSDLAYRQADRSLDVKAAALAAQAAIAIKDKDLEVALSRADLAIPDELTVAATGKLDEKSGAMEAEVTISKGGLAALAQIASALGVKNLPALAGELSGKASVRREGAKAALASAGSLRISGLAVDKEPVGKEAVVLEWSGVNVGPDPNALTIAAATLVSDLARLQAKGVEARLGKALRLAGNVDVWGDLGRCAAVGSRFTKDKRPIEIAGQLTWSGTASGKAEGITVSGAGKVEGFAAGSGANTVRIEPLTFDQAVRVDPRTEIIHLERLRVDSDVLALTASGTVSRFRTDQELDLSGHYRGDWQRLMAVVRQFAPDAKAVEIAGVLDSDFRATGPASSPKLLPTYGGVNAKAGLSWSSLQYAGFELGKADLPITFDDGQAVVPVTPVDASGGTVRLGGTVDLRGKDPQLRLPGRTVVVENVRINKEMGHALLSRFNPIFSQLLSLSGTVTLTTQDVDLPLGETIKKSGSGGGRLDLTGMQAQPSGLLAALLALGGTGEDRVHAMDIGSVDFRIRDGGIQYDNFTIAFGKSFDLRFHGTVRFDDGLDMGVSMPVKSALLQKMGVRGEVEEYARLLEGARIDLPIAGTRLAPKLDMSKLDVRPLVQRAAEALLKERVGSVLGGLLGPKPPKPTPAPPSPLPAPTPPATQPGPREPATQPAAAKPEDLLLRGLFDILDEASKRK